MKIAFSPYELTPVKNSKRSVRKGALLRITYSDDVCGYSDCHPWPELGDVPLEMQLELLRWSHPTPLMSQSLRAATIDADARRSKRNLFSDLEIPESHHHVSDLTTLEGSDFESLLSDSKSAIKIKVGVEPTKEVSIFNLFKNIILKSSCKLRLDFNCRLSKTDFLVYFNKIEFLKDAIDFIEDPFVYEAAGWEDFRKEHHIALACDRDSLQALSHPNSCDILVGKPAVQEIHSFLTPMRGERDLIITSYADHPIGQLYAAFIAASLVKEKQPHLGVCGLLTHNAFELNSFSAAFDQKGTKLVPSKEGWGWGYDALLREQVWIPLL